MFFCWFFGCDCCFYHLGAYLSPESISLYLASYTKTTFFLFTSLISPPLSPSYSPFSWSSLYLRCTWHPSCTVTAQVNSNRCEFPFIPQSFRHTDIIIFTACWVSRIDSFQYFCFVPSWTTAEKSIEAKFRFAFCRSDKSWIMVVPHILPFILGLTSPW